MSVVNTKGLRPAQAAEKLGIAVSTLWRQAKREADFPKPVKLSSRTTIFFESELDQYLAKRAAESRGLVVA